MEVVEFFTLRTLRLSDAGSREAAERTIKDDEFKASSSHARFPRHFKFYLGEFDLSYNLY